MICVYISIDQNWIKVHLYTQNVFISIREVDRKRLDPY